MKQFLREFWQELKAVGKRNYRVALAFVFGVALTAGVFVWTSPKRVDKLGELERILQIYFVEDVDPQVLEDGAAAGMVAALGDRWSLYLTKEEHEADLESMSGKYVGVGITIVLLEDESGYRITKVAQESPAEEAGVRSGDILIGADGLLVSEVGASDMKDAVAGEAGTDVELVLLRDGVEMTVTCRRDTVYTDLVQGELLEGDIGLVRIEAFRTGCAEDAIQTVQELLDQGAKKLIFDVRNNPGGYTTEMNGLLDYLLPEGPLFRTESYSGKTDVEYSDADCLDIPMAVLVNGESYSAAEFFAAALQEYEAATVVGEKTTGKGYYQTDIVLSDGSAAHLSVGKYYTPNGNSLIGVGVTPDLESAVDGDTARDIYAGILPAREDPQILAAMELLKSGK